MTFECNTRRDLSIFSQIMESHFIEVDKYELTIEINAIVCVTYRQPNTDVERLDEQLNVIMHTTKAEREISYIMGD